MPKLYLLDAYALIYRAYYALISAPRINSKGVNTSASFGFVRTLDELLRKESPDYIAIAFDPAGPTFRHEAYPDYKAQREATPEDIKRSIPTIKDIIRAYNIPILEVAGYEADDVIGTVAKMGARSGMEVHMITPDKDYAQLVEPGILMQRPGKGANPWEILGPAEVAEKYGFQSPEQMIDYLALVGDASDNVPGCPGVGPKTAVALIERFGSVEQMLQRTDELKGAQQSRIRENEEKIRFSKFLVTIKTDVPLPADFTLESLKTQKANNAELRRLFEELEFRSFIKQLDGGDVMEKAQKKAPAAPSLFDFMEDDAAEGAEEEVAAAVQAKTTYRNIANPQELEALCRRIADAGCFALGIEATQGSALDARLTNIGISIAEGEAWALECNPADDEPTKATLRALQPLLESADVEKVVHNAKDAVTILAHYGVELAGSVFDPMLAHYVLQPEQQHGMDYLCDTLLRLRMQYAATTKSDKRACEKADVTLRLKKKLAAELAKEPAIERVFREIEMPLVFVLSRMERNGVRLDAEAFREIGEDFTARMLKVEEEVYALAGHPFLITSPRQVGEVLFGELHLSDKAKKTKSGQYSTSEEILQKLSAKHPIVEKILAYRGLKKLLSTYVEALPRLVRPDTGHVHTSFNQAVTATGRLSSSNPNLQNIPVRGEDGREIRRAFVPEEGEVFFAADYSQIELRIMAHLSQDPALIQAFNSGADIHAATAARIFHKDIGDVTKDERRKAKTANFGIIYGISAFGLAERMGVGRQEAKELIENYFKTYPGVQAYIDRSINVAREKGYVETSLGRRRYLPDINSRNAVVRGYAERNAVNAPIQGTAADIMKIAMIRVDARMRAEGLRAKMLLQVHDELGFSVSPQELPRLRQLVIEEMERAFPMSVPLEADCGEGKNWLEAH